MRRSDYDVIIIGGGISGSALLFTLSRHTDVKNIALIEKHGHLAAVNSNARANSQTLHCGDIETNYTPEKAAQVKRVADMVVRYADIDDSARRHLHVHPKMVIGVGEAEVETLRQRHAQFADLFPYMSLWEQKRIAEVEPDVALVGGRARPEPIVASGTTDQVCAVDYGGLAKSFVAQAHRERRSGVDVLLGRAVISITPANDGYAVVTEQGTLFGRSVAVCAGAHSLPLAHEMGFGLDYGLLPVAGSFFYIPRPMNGKVYTLQNPKLPFAALHADPDVTNPGRTRLGPTALLMPKLERYRSGGYMEFLKTLKPDRAIAKALWGLLSDRDILTYVTRNLLFEVPGIRHSLFARDARKIVPSLHPDELSYARGVGGLRPQVIDRRQGKLVLGEAVIDPGNGLMFSITPSPGATTCLGNAERQAEAIAHYLGRHFDTDRHTRELHGDRALPRAA